jgi:hypothetical protein
MGQGGRFKHGLARVAIAALALLILAAGLCLLDHDQDGAGGHSIPRDLCLVALLVSPVILLATALLPGGLVVSLGPSGRVTAPIRVPEPIPRACLAQSS